jgi:hypothetical protein
MGTITRSFANNITTSGVLLPASLTNNSIANVTAYNAAIATGGMVLLSSQTASASASISFTTGINSTYKEYQFYFINIVPATSSNIFTFQGSTDGGSNYGVTTTTSHFMAYHNQADTDQLLGYQTTYDQAQTTGYIRLSNEIRRGGGSASNVGGSLTLFNPASTTYVKHFMSRCVKDADTSFELFDQYQAGYMNTTSAVNAVQFKMNTGNIDGTILMYGIV